MRAINVTLAGLVLVAASASAPPASAATGDPSTDQITTSSRSAAGARVDTRVLTAKDTALSPRGTPTPTAGPVREHSTFPA